MEGPAFDDSASSGGVGEGMEGPTEGTPGLGMDMIASGVMQRHLCSLGVLSIHG